MESAYDTRHKQMTETPIPKLITKLAVPTIISMLVTSIYNMADTYFVSQINTSASAAVGVIFSLMAIIQTIGFTFGMGAGTMVSRLLGEKKHTEASEMAATGFFVAVGIGLVLTIAGLSSVDWLVRILGATETIAPYAKDYAKYILIAAPYMIGAFVLNNLLRSQGNAAISMIGISVGAVLNIILDPLFIFTFKMGISGAAIATILSQFVSFCLLIAFSFSEKSSIKISLSYVRITKYHLTNIIKLGFPTFCRQGLASVAAVCLNIAAGVFGDSAIAVMSIVQRITFFIISALIGFGQGFQPVCGFNYGAKRYDRVMEAYWFCVKTSVIFLTVIAVVMVIISPQVITQFRKEDVDAIQMGTLALRLQCLTLPLQGYVIMSNMFYQATSRALRATITSMSRQGLSFIPLIFSLPIFLGLLGIQVAQPIADVLTFVLVIFLNRYQFREINELKAGVNL